eukprot:1033905-Rhodomonas_salina.4
MRGVRSGHGVAVPDMAYTAKSNTRNRIAAGAEGDADSLPGRAENRPRIAGVPQPVPDVAQHSGCVVRCIRHTAHVAWHSGCVVCMPHKAHTRLPTVHNTRQTTNNTTHSTQRH